MATINLLVVVGLVGVQRSQLPGDGPPNFVTQYLIYVLLVLGGMKFFIPVFGIMEIPRYTGISRY